MTNFTLNIKSQLKDLAEPEYQKFASSLIPGIPNLLGVRLPTLRRLAGGLAKDDWRAYVAAADDEYFEDTMLQGMVIGLLKEDIEVVLAQVALFIPKINNWSICDSFCAGLKITKQHKERVWQFLQPYLAVDEPYAIRFAVVMLLNYYLDEEYAERVLRHLDQIQHEHYYVKMAVAWAISICYIKLPNVTYPYLQQNRLDDFTFNKALQKIVESQQVDQQTRQMIRAMKRK